MLRRSSAALVVAGAMMSCASAFGSKSTAKEVQSAYGSLVGKTAVVTGANSGIGLEAAKVLASAGCRVVACARDADKGRSQIVEEMTSPGLGGYALTLDQVNERVAVKELDLASLASVAKFAESLEEEGHIDFLILNAGIMATPKRQLTTDGFESQIGTNHFGHFHLADLLYPRLVSGGGKARVVTVASTAHTFGAIDLDDLHYDKGRTYAPWAAYGQSKLANVLFAKGLANRLKADGHADRVISVSLHPGVIRTNLWKETAVKKFGIVAWLSDRLLMDKSIPQGAATTVWAALSPDVDSLPQGSYLADCAVATLKAPQALDEDLVDKFWKLTAQQIKTALARCQQ